MEEIKKELEQLTCVIKDEYGNIYIDKANILSLLDTYMCIKNDDNFYARTFNHKEVTEPTKTILRLSSELYFLQDKLDKAILDIEDKIKRTTNNGKGWIDKCIAYQEVLELLKKEG